MNYDELQQIIKYIRKNLTCPACGKAYLHKGMEVLSTFDDQGLFHLHCNSCQNSAMVHVTISEDESIMTKQAEEHHHTIRTEQSADFMPIYRQQQSLNLDERKDKVTVNDVIDIHSFLTEFKGDFKSLFHK